MISLLSNQALRGGESLPEHIREFFGGAMLTITICAPLILFACYHGHKAFFQRVDHIVDLAERWMEKQMVRLAKPQKPVLPVTMPATMKRSVSEPILRQFPSDHPLTRRAKVVQTAPTTNKVCSPPHTPIYMSGELTFSYNPKTAPVKEEV
jgi:hypothetical protein